MNNLAVAVLLLLGVFSQAVLGHMIIIEEEAYAEKPWETSRGDASFDSPLRLSESILTSQSVFSWLDENDYDVFEFTVTKEHIATAKEAGFPGLMLLAAALPPACAELRNLYPAVALLAPVGMAGVESVSSDMRLPFSVPDNYGISIGYNRPVPIGGQRAILRMPGTVFADPRLGASDVPLEEHSEPDAHDFGGPMNLSWFMPTGCIESPQLDCKRGDFLKAMLETEMSAYLVVWNPTGEAMDYTLNIGIDESAIEHEPDKNDIEFVRNNDYVHFSCTAL